MRVRETRCREQQALDGFEKDVEIEGFFQAGLHLQVASGLAELPIRRHHHDWRASAQVVFAALVEEGPAVHAWHHQIQHDGVWLRRLDHRQRLVAIGGFLDAVALELESLGNDVAYRVLVIDNQDALRAGNGHWTPLFRWLPE